MQNEITENIVANFLCFLIDNYECQPLSEEKLQEIGHEFMQSDYNKPEVLTDDVKERIEAQMAVNDNLILFIEPKNPPSKHPVIDEATCVMTQALRLAKTGVANYREDASPNDFREGSGYRGFHVCSCGMISSNCDYLLPNGEITTSLAIHYLAYHREEVSEEQIKRVLALMPEESDPKIPTDKELKVPKNSVGKDIDRVLKQFAEEANPRPEPSSYGDKTWAVGFKDRGHGHGDFGVIDQDGKIIAELPLNEDDRTNAHLIVSACNHHKELVYMLEHTLDMIDADEIPNVLMELANINKRLKEIKEGKI